MIRPFLRRILWIPLITLSAAFLTFLLLARRPEFQNRNLFLGSYQTLPLFLNWHPADTRILAQTALTGLEQNPNALVPSHEITYLGGAALPHILPALDGLSPQKREQVAQALLPIGLRMELSGLKEAEQKQQVAAFWTNFWEERSLDFRSMYVRRAVKRYGKHPTFVRKRELLVLDTHALSAIIAEIGEDGAIPDPYLARTLLPIAFHALAWEQPNWNSLSDEELENQTKRLREFWFEHRVDFQSLTGSERAIASVTETQFGKWAARTVLGNSSEQYGGTSVANLLWERSLVTVKVMILGLVIGLGLALGTSVLSLRYPGTQRFWVHWASLCACSPPLLLGWWMRNSQHHLFLGGLVLAAGLVLWFGQVIRTLVVDTLSGPWVITFRSQGASWSRVVSKAIRPALADVGLLVVFALPELLGATFVIEKLCNIKGLGDLLVHAVQERDLSLLMAMSVGGTLVATLGMVTSETLRQLIDVRFRQPQRSRWS
jgi:peptide/nickel transport system permease protein